MTFLKIIVGIIIFISYFCEFSIFCRLCKIQLSDMETGIARPFIIYFYHIAI